MSSNIFTLETKLNASIRQIETDTALTEQQRTEKFVSLLESTCQSLESIIADNPSVGSSLKVTALLKSLSVTSEDTLRKLRIIDKTLTDIHVDEHNDAMFARFFVEGQASLSTILDAMEKDLTTQQ